MSLATKEWHDARRDKVRDVLRPEIQMLDSIRNEYGGSKQSNDEFFSQYKNGVRHWEDMHWCDELREGYCRECMLHAAASVWFHVRRQISRYGDAWIEDDEIRDEELEQRILRLKEARAL